MADISQSYYYLSNDDIDLSPYVFEKRKGNVFVGVANPHCFHAIPLDVDFSRIYLMDINPTQVEHLKFMIQCIKESNDRMEFVKRLLRISLPDDIDPSKDNIWQHATWTGDPIGQMTDGGIIFDAANSFGEITKHRLSLFGDPADPSCFCVGLNKGWLQSEETFNKIKSVCKKIKLFNNDITRFYLTNWDELRYHHVVLWMSNLLSPWFYNAIAPIQEFWDRLNHHLEPSLPRDEIDVRVIFDRRTHIPVDPRFIKGKPLSPHFKTFREVVLELGNKNIEVPGVDRWVDEDGGVSKLPRTNYVKISDFGHGEHIDVAFLHSVLSHGRSPDEFMHAVNCVRPASKKVLVLEFNKDTKDQIDGIGISPETIHELLGTPRRMIPCYGNSGDVRNWLYVY